MAGTESNGYASAGQGAAASALVTGRCGASIALSCLFSGVLGRSESRSGTVPAKPESSRQATALGLVNTTAAAVVRGGEPDTFGLVIPLSDPVPLRSSTAWGQFVSPVPLPVGYGRITITPIPYDNTGRLFFLLDHAVQAVEGVTRDDVADTQYTLENTIDGEGHAISLLRLARPAATNEKIAVILRARMHPVTGELLTNPADILWDLLANVCGLTVEYGDLDTFRSRCLDIGIQLHGVLESDSITIRAQIDEIMASCGGVWSGGMPGLARIYPE